jgi:hypothetical protein
MDSKLDLKAEFEKDLAVYINNQAKAGFNTDMVNKILRSRGSMLDAALFLVGGEKTNQLFVLKKLNAAQFSIEALALKKKYETLIPGNLRIKARQKLESVGFDFAAFDFEEV